MTITDYLFISLILTLGLLAINLVFVYALYQRNRYLNQRQKTVYAHLQNLLESANDQAEEIVSQAVKKAGKTLSDSVFLRQDLSSQLHHSFRQALQQRLDQLKSESAEFETEYTQALEHVTKDSLQSIASTTKDELAQFRQTLTKEIIDTHNELRQKVDTEYAAAKQEIEEYKKTELQNAHQQINQIIAKASKEVLGKSLTLEDQEQLIFDALERAKKDGVFK